MRKRAIIVGILCSLFFLSALVSASLSCSITTRAGCTNTSVLYIQNDSGGYENAHVQNVSVNSYAYALCCSSAVTTLTSTCQSTPWFKLSNLTNAHVQFGNYSGPGTVYDLSVCVGSSVGNLTCNYYSGGCPASYQVAVGSLASSNVTKGNLSDAHFGSGTKYRMKQCCFISGLYPDSVFQGQTPANGSIQNALSIPVNLSTTTSYGLHYAFVDFDSSLVGGWRMDTLNGSGGVVDITGRYNASNMSGAFQNSTEGSGKFGKGYAFDGTNDYLYAGVNVPGTDVVNKTVSAWVRIRSNKQQSIIDKAFDSGTYGGWSFWIQSTGKLWWWAHANKDVYDTGTAIPVGNWTHVAVVWNANTKNTTFYLNGLFNSQSQDATIVEQSSGSSWLVLGAMRNASNFFLNGQLDEVLLFNRTFSAREISALYNASATKYYNNFTGLAVATHTYKGYAVDVTGNVNSTETRTVTIASADIVAPEVTIVSPTNTTYTSLPLLFNVRLQENGTVRYTLDNGITNYTMTGNASSTGFNATNASIADGSYTFRVYVNDTTGNINNTVAVTFSVDTTAPLVTVISPLSFNYTSLPLLVNVSLNEGGSVWYSLSNGLVNYSLSANGSATGFTGTNASIADGAYVLLLYANDSAGNSNSTVNVTFSMYPTGALITLTNPGAGVSYEADSQQVNFQFSVINVSALTNCTLLVNNALLNSTTTPNVSTGGVTPFSQILGTGTFVWNVSCTTIYGLVNTSTSRSFTIAPAVSSGSGASSSGGGGGSGGFSAPAATSSTNESTVVRASDRSPFLEVPEGLSFSVFINVATTRSFIVKNLRSYTVTLTVGMEGLDDYLSVGAPLTIQPGEEREITLAVKALREGLLTGMILLSDGSRQVRIPTVLNIRSENFLFDAGIAIRSEGKRVVQGDGLKTQINLLQVGPKQKVDVVATYVIKDFSGKIYLEETETFYVLESKEFVKEFDTSQLPEGTYILGLEIQYPGAFATSSSQFEVVSSSLISSPLLLGAIVGGLLVLGSTIIGLSLWRRRSIHHLVHRR